MSTTSATASCPVSARRSGGSYPTCDTESGPSGGNPPTRSGCPLWQPGRPAGGNPQAGTTSALRTAPARVHAEFVSHGSLRTQPHQPCVERRPERVGDESPDVGREQCQLQRPAEPEREGVVDD